ncbi:hypothetical protein ACFE04_013632 [Oxalis oulophora]
MPPSSLFVPVSHTPAAGGSHRSLFVNPSRPLCSRQSPDCRMFALVPVHLSPSSSLRLLPLFLPVFVCLLPLFSSSSVGLCLLPLFPPVFVCLLPLFPSSSVGLRLLPLFPSVFVRPPSTPSVPVCLLSLFSFY